MVGLVEVGHIGVDLDEAVEQLVTAAIWGQLGAAVLWSFLFAHWKQKSYIDLTLISNKGYKYNFLFCKIFFYFFFNIAYYKHNYILLIFDWEATTKSFHFFFYYYFQEQNKNLNSKIYKSIENIFCTKLKFSCLTKKKQKKKKERRMKRFSKYFDLFFKLLISKNYFYLNTSLCKEKGHINRCNPFLCADACIYICIIMHSINPHLVKLFSKTLAWPEGHTIFINTQHDAFALRVKVCGGDLCVGTVGQ